MALDAKRTDSPSDRRRAAKAPALAIIGVFVGGFAHSILPRGVFGPSDLLVRAGITGAAAALATGMLLSWALRHRDR